MAKSISVRIRTDPPGSRNATLDIVTDLDTWEKFESNNANNVFTTKKGSWRLTGDGGSSPPTELRKPSGQRAGILYNFDPDTAQTGQSNQGLTDEAGTGFIWTVLGITEI